MRLSEAIRLGAMLKPQGFGADALKGTRTCALGAACDAVGLPETARLFEIGDRWPWLLTLDVLYPGKPNLYMEEPTTWARRAIWFLNDVDKWSREQIADWVETIEQAQALTTVPESEAVTVPA